MIVNACENSFFPLPERPLSFQEGDKNKNKEFITQKERPKNNVNEFNKLILEKEKSINKQLFKKYFKHQSPTDLLKTLYNTKDTKRNKIQGNLIKSELIDVNSEIRKMSKNEFENEQSNKIVNIVEKILDFNNQNQEGNGLKIQTPDQILSILPATLAQFKAGNN